MLLLLSDGILYVAKLHVGVTEKKTHTHTQLLTFWTVYPKNVVGCQVFFVLRPADENNKDVLMKK